MAEVYDPFKGQTIIIREGMVKKNMNPPQPTTERPPAPNSQVAPSSKLREQKKKGNEASSQG